MTKEQYFEMCEMLGAEPKDSEIPVEFGDLPLDVQEAYHVYSHLKDTWNVMDGSYTGKDYAGILDVLEIMGIEDKRSIFSIIELLDRKRKEAIRMTTPSEPTK